MAITKVPNGPLIKKKGPFKGSTLKAGGKIKKAINGTTTTQTTTPPVKKSWNQMSVAERLATRDKIKLKGGREGWSQYMDSTLTADFEKGALKRGLTVDEYRNKLKKDAKKPDVGLDNLNTSNSSQKSSSQKAPCKGGFCTGLNIKSKNGSSIKKAKAGAMIKRADGSMSKRGLWDNIRANKGSGKKPTAAMLKQEKKIKAKK